MPIIDSFQNSHVHCAVWKIEEDVSELEAQLGHDPFLRPILETMSHSAIQKRFLAGRLAIQYLVSNLGLDYQGTQRMANGQPVLFNLQDYCSISHTEGYATAAVSRIDVVGVDLEAPKDQLKIVTPKFLTEDEADWANNDLMRLARLWVAKEAAYKLICMDDVFLKSHFKMVEEGEQHMMVLFQDGESAQNIEVSFREVDGHVLGLAQKQPE